MNTLRYKNNTSTSIQLIRGDVRNAPESYVVIGRSPEMKEYYENLIGSDFKPLDTWYSNASSRIQICKNENLSVLRTTYRPRHNSRKQQTQALEFQVTVGLPLAIAFAQAKRVAMIPLSFRRPQIVAKVMIRMMWDTSVASFLNVPRSFDFIRPEQFSIYCDAPLDPFVNELERGHYASLRYGWLFNSDVQCDPRKRARYLRRKRFKFRQVPSA